MKRPGPILIIEINIEKKRISDERGLIEEEKSENEFKIVSDGGFESDSSDVY